MNILLVSTGGYIGGEETFTKNLALNLLARGYNVMVAPGGQVQMNDLRKSNISIADINIKGRSLTGLYKGAKAIEAFVLKNKIDIVHCQAAGPAIMGAFIKMMRRNHGEKWIYHDHGINKMTYKWLSFFLNILDLTITNSDYELIKLKSNRVKESKIVRIHNGIDLKDYCFKIADKENNRNSIRMELGILEQEYVIGYIGRLSPEKGCDLILPAFIKVLEKKASTSLLIIGDGILRASMQERVRFNNLDRKVIFTGFRNDIAKLLCSIDVLILPSYMETFSLTTLQAMGAGIPVIASDTGGNPEQIIHKFNGYLFKTGDYLDLYFKIIDMIENKSSAVLGINGIDLVKRYLNINRMVDEIEIHYNKI